MPVRIADLYDSIYAWNDYRADAQRLRALIEKYRRREVKSLLDVACGTGMHASFLKESYHVEGLDIDPEMLAIARQRNPDVTFHQGDMTRFSLPERFDAVTCLFSAIAAVKTLSGLRDAIRNFAQHVNAGGVVIVEPWLSPEDYEPGTPRALFVDRPDLKLARINLSQLARNVAVSDLHYLVGTPQGVEYLVEHLELGLFTAEEYMGAFRAAGLDVTHDVGESGGRGRYVGVKPPAIRRNRSPGT